VYDHTYSCRVGFDLDRSDTVVNFKVFMWNFFCSLIGIVIVSPTRVGLSSVSTAVILQVILMLHMPPQLRKFCVEDTSKFGEL
jgi:hypothetical protein